MYDIISALKATSPIRANTLLGNLPNFLLAMANSSNNLMLVEKRFVIFQGSTLRPIDTTKYHKVWS